MKMVTVEPAMDLDVDVMFDWITQINPVMVWLGYDSKRANLPAPPLEKVFELNWRLACEKITVILKTIPADQGQPGIEDLEGQAVDQQTKTELAV